MFKKIKEIRSRKGVLHFQRWCIISIKNLFSINLHIIYKADEDNHLHNHPWNFISMVLWGRYVERLEDRLVNRFPLQISYRRKNVFHKIHMLLSRKVVTLNIMFSKQKEWGYKVDGGYVNSVEYRENKNFGRINNMVSCKKDLYKSTYKSNAFNINDRYIISSEDNEFYYIIDNNGREFNFSKANTKPYYYFEDYFLKL